jgi:hypothetical protein
MRVMGSSKEGEVVVGKEEVITKLKDDCELERSEPQTSRRKEEEEEKKSCVGLGLVLAPCCILDVFSLFAPCFLPGIPLCCSIFMLMS